MATKRLAGGPVDSKIVKDAQKTASMLVKEKQIMVLTVDGPWPASNAGVMCKVFVKYPNGDLKETVMDLVAIPREFAESLLEGHYSSVTQLMQAGKKPRFDTPAIGLQTTGGQPTAPGNLRTLMSSGSLGMPSPLPTSPSTSPYAQSAAAPAAGVFSAAAVPGGYSSDNPPHHHSQGMPVSEAPLTVDPLDLFPPVNSIPHNSQGVTDGPVATAAFNPIMPPPAHTAPAAYPDTVPSSTLPPPAHTAPPSYSETLPSSNMAPPAQTAPPGYPDPIPSSTDAGGMQGVGSGAGSEAGQLPHSFPGSMQPVDLAVQALQQPTDLSTVGLNGDSSHSLQPAGEAAG